MSLPNIRSRATVVMIALVIAHISSGCESSGNLPKASILIPRVTIVDGSGSPAYSGDILISGDRIVRIAEPGAVAPSRGMTVLADDGLTACPGFIDVHSHDDLTLIDHPEQLPKVMMGVTTVIGGNCGLGMAPFSGDPSTAFEGLDIQGLLPIKELRRRTFGEWAAQIDSLHPGTNVGLLVPHVLIRTQFLGPARRRPSPDELANMKDSLRQAMREGALGMSSGLEYMPGTWTEPAEIIELLRVVGEFDGVYGTHMRNEGENLLRSVEEAIAAAREAGVRLQISHLKSVMPYQGLVRKALGLIDAAVRDGLTVYADQYPYTASSTSLAAYLRWGYVREYPESFLIVFSEAKPEAAGKRLDRIAREMGLEPEQAARALLPAAAVQFCMDEDDVRYVMRHPRVLVSTDGLDVGRNPHPRLYGTYPRVLGRYVRQTSDLDLETAVWKMTGLPAKAFNLKDRGILRVGALADIVIFDPRTIEDRATYEEPRQYPDGIRYVLVNGTVTVDRGEYTGKRAGRFIRRS